jgi:hypothetical protein
MNGAVKNFAVDLRWTIDDFCNKPVQRPPVKGYGQVFTVDATLTGS